MLFIPYLLILYVKDRMTKVHLFQISREFIFPFYLSVMSSYAVQMFNAGQSLILI